MSILLKTPEQIAFAQVEGSPVPSKRKMKAVRASKVTKKKPQWLWRGFIPDRKLSILASDPGLGKSLVTCAVTANVTLGGTWPDGTPCPQGSVIMLNAEDLDDEDITPRLEACGADLDKVTLTDSTVSEEASETEKVFSLKHDIESLIALYEEQYPDEVDQFEDLLCKMLGIYRHPVTSLDGWRVQRVRAINGAGEEADRLAVEAESRLEDGLPNSNFALIPVRLTPVSMLLLTGGGGLRKC